MSTVSVVSGENDIGAEIGHAPYEHWRFTPVISYATVSANTTIGEPRAIKPTAAKAKGGDFDFTGYSPPPGMS